MRLHPYKAIQSCLGPQHQGQSPPGQVRTRSADRFQASATRKGFLPSERLWGSAAAAETAKAAAKWHFSQALMQELQVIKFAASLASWTAEASRELAFASCSLGRAWLTKPSESNTCPSCSIAISASDRGNEMASLRRPCCGPKPK